MPFDLPNMIIEFRENTPSHGLNPPSRVGSPEFEEQLADTMEFVDFVKTNRTGYPTELLDKYLPIERTESYYHTLKKIEFNNFREVTFFVEDDQCNEFFTRIAKYLTSEGYKTREDKGFINGTGLGVHDYYLAETAKYLQLTFDVKYHFKHPRPLQVLKDRTGMVCSNFFNYMHPNHWEYITGHGCKAFSAARCAYELWDIPKSVYNELLIMMYVCSMGRSGGGVHYTTSNVASGYIVGLPEFEKFGIPYQNNPSISPLVLV